MKKPESVTIAMRSPAPIEHSNDPRRPRPSFILECALRAMQILRTKPPGSHVQFTYPDPDPQPTRLLRDLEARQAWVEASIRASRRLEHERVMNHLANERERRRRPMFISELHAQLRAKMT